MKHYKIIDIPATKQKKHIKTTCDLCGEEIVDQPYYLDEVCLSRREGSNYPEGGSGTEVEIDMCGKCFESRLIPWLKEQGCDPKKEDWDW